MLASAYNDTIIDAHCHLASTHFIPRTFIEGVASNIVTKLIAMGVSKSIHAVVDNLSSQHQDHQGDRLIKEMDDAGIAQAILLLPDFTYATQCECTIAEMYDLHATVRDRHPGRFYVFAGVDPRWGIDGLNLFEHGIRNLGFHGLKLYPPCGYNPSDRSLYPFYEICAQHDLPVLVHIGPSSPTLSFMHAHPWLLDQAAKDFPRLNFILAHGAVHFVSDCVALCAYRPNIFLDISAFPSISHPGGWSKALDELFHLNINHKILFGTDWPLQLASSTQKQTIQRFTSQDGPLAGISVAQRHWVMHANVLRLLQHKSL